MKAIALAMIALFASIGVACGNAVAQSPSSTDSEASSPASVTDDFEGQWKQLVSQFPEAAEYRVERTARVPLQELLNWAPPGKATTIYDRVCRPIRVERRDDVLYGLVNEQTSVKGATKNVHADEVLLGAGIVVTCGFYKHYRRGNDGQWINEGTSAMGSCARPVGLLLSKVTSDAAWYNDQLVRLSIACTKKLDEESSCAGGGSRQCTRCLEWGIHATSLDQGYGMWRHVPTVTSKVTAPVDCSRPCPSMDLPDGSKKAQEALKGREFLTEGPEEHPFLFRTRAACTRYRRQHPIPADELRVW